MNLQDRLREREFLNQTQKSIEDPAAMAGRQAERFLKSLINSNLKYKDTYYFINKRIPARFNARHYEIDLMVLTKKQLNIIEVKNWSGSLFTSNGYWVQLKRNGDKIKHKNPL